ncbi:hypothetical protein ABPG77_005999 [Micractinium sp. CCAP 211/92]
MAASPFCGAPSGKVQLAGQPRRRQPLVVLSLLLNLLLLGASATWWSGSFTLSANGSSSGSRSDIALRRRAPVARGADAWEACERAQLDVQKLADWGCTVFDRVCFDQDGIILHDGRKTPSHPDYTDQPLFKVVGVPSYVLPGYAEPLGTAHFLPKCWDLRLRGPTQLDPPDIWQPAEFTNCTVPLVWWPTYFSIFADLFIGSALALDAMQAEGAFDRNVLLAPVSLGMDLPPMYRSLLSPYSRHQPMSFSALSSREHAITGRPRCFERAALCNLVGMYISSPEHHWPELLPKTVGRRAVEHFRREHPEEFAQQDRLAAADNNTVFRVAFQRRGNGMRLIRNLPQVLEECKQWRPPKASRFTSVDCILLPDGTAENHVKIIAQVQNVHALVNTHGSGLTYSFFMPGGTGVVEILAWNFHGEGCTWADQYFRFLCVCVCVCVINVRGRFDNAPASLHAADAGHSVRHAQCRAAAPPQLGQPLLA